ncbi:SDR family NAD(P)-dependent oxidoreductase [Actinomadura macra]|uniref:SDR family NAD(P)-dependent oxidoreductase n=1 Tax=Actinomadura macra TaxID=46164 RepID=UPI0008373BE5|nr:SDR family NAD(P)-dependent oxidoreductase [Actinomadura macra]
MADLGLDATGHPILGAAVRPADGDGHVLTGRVTRQRPSWLVDHVVLDTMPVPGAAQLEWALRAADECGCAAVEELVLQTPLVVPEQGGLSVQVVVGRAGDDGRRDVGIYSRADADWTCHATGVLSATPISAASGEPGEAGAVAWPPTGAEPVGIDDFYERTAAAGYGYGPAFQGLRAVWRDGRDVLAEIELPEPVEDRDGYGVHPVLVDAALHSLLLIGRFGDERVWLPFTWNGVTLHAVGATSVRVRLSPLGTELDRGVRMTITDPLGAPVLEVDSVVLRQADARQLRAAGERPPDGLYTVDWTELPVLADHAGVPPEARDWAALGSVPAEWGLPGHADLDALVAALEAGAPVPRVVLAGVGPADGDDGLALVKTALGLVRGWLAEPRLADARLVILTRGAVSTAGDVDLSGAGVWGLVRSAQSEHPGRFVLLDLDPRSGAGPVAVAAAVAGALDADEPQIALRDGALLVPRWAGAGAATELAGPAGHPAWRLATAGTATLENVSPVPCPEVLEPLEPGQVRVAVHAAGVNFRDVLIALGMYPDEGVFAGSEGAGVVLDVAPDVTGLKAGDRVMGLFEGAFGTVAVADARMVAPMPPGWIPRVAAGVPVAYLTAWYGLVDLAGLDAGESVLIHAATGGVGMAAVQIARHLGAEVYATASPGKHAVLERMGVDEGHRASSRDLGFEDAVRRATGGRGVDVVLNSLAGEFTDASLRLLADGGRFVEMGKTDLRDPERVAADRPGVRYRSFDLVGDAGPERVGAMLATLMGLFRDGALDPLPVEAWPLGRAREAFRFMSQAKHTGKLVLDVPAPLDPDGTVLITGGTGTLGGLVAEHLVRTWNLRRLLLVSRRGLQAPGAGELVARLEGLGADITVAAADVTDPAGVTDTIAGIDPRHPLTAVVHAAGVLDDVTVASLTPERLERVWAAKATAAANLHTATAGLRLGLFVIFSSAAAAAGSPGQAGYAAANAYCDALAAHRRARGLPGLSIGWGLWASASAMTGHLTESDLSRMGRTGFTPLGDERGLALMDAACRHGRPHLLAVDLDAGVLAGGPSHTVPAPLRALAAAHRPGRSRATAAAPGERPDGLLGRLAGLSPAEQNRLLLTLVRTHAATVLGHSGPAAVSAETPFKELGFDSLTAVELRNRLSAATGLRLPPALVFDYPEATVLAAHLRRELAPDGTEPPPGDPVDPLLSDLGRIEGALTALPMEGDARDRVARRLHALLATLDAAAGAPGDDLLDGASDEEMFEFIDREL